MKNMEIPVYKTNGSVKNVGVEDTPRISEPLSFFEKNAVFIGSYGSIPQIVCCRICLFFSKGFTDIRTLKDNIAL